MKNVSRFNVLAQHDQGTGGQVFFSPLGSFFLCDVHINVVGTCSTSTLVSEVSGVGKTGWEDQLQDTQLAGRMCNIRNTYVCDICRVRMGSLDKT